MKHTYLALAAMFAFAAVGLAQPINHVILQDLSDSNPANTLYSPAAERLVFSQMNFGDTVTIIPVRGSDLLAPPILDQVLPTILPTDGISKGNEAKRARKAVVEAGRKAVAETTSPQARSNETALMATLGRVRLSNRTRILLLTDAMECTQRTVCLERTPITPENVRSLVSRALKGAMLPHDLTGAEVEVVLPGIIPKNPPVNSAAQLRLFWDLAIRSLHGTLKSLDAQINPW